MKVEVNGENFKKMLELTNEIDSRINNVIKETSLYSTHHHLLTHPDFIILTLMGPKIIPYLFHKATQYGWNWVIIHLFQKISGEKPVPKEHIGMFNFITLHWHKWFLESKYYEETKNDVYYGLVN